MSVCLSWGEWGGIYVLWNSWKDWRLCVGWLALTVLPEEIDEYLALAVAALQTIVESERASWETLPHADDILELMDDY